MILCPFMTIVTVFVQDGKPELTLMGIFKANEIAPEHATFSASIVKLSVLTR